MGLLRGKRRQHLTRFRGVTVKGIHLAKKKPINGTRVQGSSGAEGRPHPHPPAFLECLGSAGVYTDVSLGSGAGQAVLKAHSTSQSAQTRGENDRSWRQGPHAPFPGLEPAFRGFKNRDLRADAEAGRRAEPTGSIPASVTQGHQPPCDGAPSSPPPKGPRDIHESPGFRRPHPQWRAGLRAKQGAQCLEQSHWKGVPQRSRKEAKETTVSWPTLAGSTRGRRRGLKGPRGSLKEPRLTLTVAGRTVDILVTHGLPTQS